MSTRTQQSKLNSQRSKFITSGALIKPNANPSSNQSSLSLSLSLSQSDVVVHLHAPDVNRNITLHPLP